MNQATGPSDGELHQRVREGLGNGKLFRVDGNGLAGRGTQQRCTVCNRPVLTYDLEIRIEEPRQAFAHLKCYAIWLEEHDQRPLAYGGVGNIVSLATSSRNCDGKLAFP